MNQNTPNEDDVLFVDCKQDAFYELDKLLMKNVITEEEKEIITLKMQKVYE